MKNPEKAEKNISSSTAEVMDVLIKLKNLKSSTNLKKMVLLRGKSGAVPAEHIMA